MTIQKVAVLGSGPAGDALSNGFLKHGYTTMRASREPGKLAAWKSSAKGEAAVGSYADAAKWAELIVLVVKGLAAEEVLDQAGPANLAGKTVIDVTNPIANAPPQNGVLQYFTAQNESLMERLQKKVPQAHFVKAFNSVSNAVMVNPKLVGDVTPTMYICGDDAGAKAQTTEILTKFGWESKDLGSSVAARPIESLCMLYCVSGILHGDWTYAIKYVKGA